MEDFQRMERYKKRNEYGVYTVLWDQGLGSERCLENMSG